jgi:AraC-like DNA-binding protein
MAVDEFQQLTTIELIGKKGLVMASVDQWLTWSVAAAGLASTLSVLLRRHKSNLDVIFAIFCGSLAMAILRPNLNEYSGWLIWVVTLGGCATCNMYWLFSRALFRGEAGVQRRHVAAALAIALLILVYRVAQALDSEYIHGWITSLGAVLTLASSTVLVLAFVEALRGWSLPMALPEKRLRVGFMLVFGACVLACTILSELADTTPALEALRRVVVCSSALLIIVFTHYALYVRRRFPIQQANSGAHSEAPATQIKAEDHVLADAIRHQLHVLHVFREPDLKVADLASQLGVPEYKVSRVVTQVLGERNFNQLVNRYRIANACQLLQQANSKQSVLEISMECGFASLGPFNRAFKAAIGVTPSAYRASQLALKGTEVINV